MTTKAKPLSLKNVSLKGDFWEERLKINREVTLPIEYEQCKTTGRIDVWKLDWKPGDPKPHFFWDSDVAKWIEAVAYSIGSYPDKNLEQKADDVINLIANAQQPDGYLNTYFIAVEPEKRWKNLRDFHELYCAGHLIEAAVAYYEATGKDKLLNTLCKYVDYIYEVFGTKKGKLRGYPGHEEIELALVRLYRITDNLKHLELAKYFIDERGQKPYYFNKEAKKLRDQYGNLPFFNHPYFQAHLPVREQNTAEGHSVRACYLYSGMADVANETNDIELIEACKTLWKNIVEKRMYIHGGIGSTRHGERFTYDYDLPNESAYAETCAAISLVFFAHRMLQIDVNSEYSNVMEKALYNGIISGVSLDGKRFFYENFLASVPGDHEFKQLSSPQRKEWFGCACCPPNLARLLASLGQYVYSQNENTIFTHLYISGNAKFNIAGNSVKIEQNSNYPWDGNIEFKINSQKALNVTLAFRIPDWCNTRTLKINNDEIILDDKIKKGYAYITREWKDNDTISLTLDMPPVRIESNPSVRENIGRIALERGPILYCLESIDNGKDLNSISLIDSSEIKVIHDNSIFKEIPLLTAKAKRQSKENWNNMLYRQVSDEGNSLEDITIKAIPYFMWANRGENEMLVWIRN